jgi:hypothetical protein
MKNHLQHQLQLKRNSGYILIFSIIIIASIMTVVVIRGALTTTTNLEKNFTLVNEQKIELYTEGCLEEGLIQMNRDEGYAGDSYSIDSGTCVVSVSGSGNVRTVSASGELDGYFMDLSADVTLVPFVITSWDE